MVKPSDDQSSTTGDNADNKLTEDLLSKISSIVNSAITQRLTKFEEKMLEVQNAKAPEKPADKPIKGETEEARALKEMQSQMAAWKQEKAEMRAATALETLKATLLQRGVRAELMDAAVALHSSKVGYAEDGKTLTWQIGETKLPLADGVDLFVSSDAGQVFLAPTKTSGSGHINHNKKTMGGQPVSEDMVDFDEISSELFGS